MHRPAGGDAVAFWYLILNRDPKIRKDRMVDADRFANAGVSAKLHPVDVVDEVGAVKLSRDLEVATRADPLQRAPSLGALLVLLGCPERRFRHARNPFKHHAR